MRDLAITALINAIVSVAFGLFTLWQRGRTFKNVSFFLLSISIAFYSSSYFLWQIAPDVASAELWFYFLFEGVIIINVCYLIFVFSIVDSVERRRNEILFHVALACGFTYCNFANLFFVGLEPRFGLGFWPKPTPLFNIFLIIWVTQCLYGFILMYGQLDRRTGESRNQLKYYLIASMFGFFGGATNWPVWYSLYLPPFFTIGLSLYIAIVSYAIVRYHLIDFRVAISSTGIFLFVYLLALGLPLALLAKGHPAAAVWLAVGLSSTAPFIYVSLTKQAEDKILSRERAYQRFLDHVGQTLQSLKTIDEIAARVVQAIYSEIKVKNVAIYLLEADRFVLKTGAGDCGCYAPELCPDLAIITHCKARGATFMDEFRSINKESCGCCTKCHLASHPVNVAMPLRREDLGGIVKVTGLLLLGEKLDRSPYSEQDIQTLNKLAGSIAFAVESAVFRKMVHDQLVHEDTLARREFLDQIVSTMGHEIKNPNAVIAAEAFSCLEDVKERKTSEPDPFLDKMEKSLDNVLRFSKKISKLIHLILHFSRDHEFKVTQVQIHELLEDIDLFVKSILKGHPGTEFEKQIAENLPPVLGDGLRMEEIINNYLNNAAHAVRNNSEGNKRISLRIYPVDHHVRIEVTDNGYGIKPEVRKKLFTAPMTTKTHNEGNGLGLWQVRQLCDRMDAKCGIDSEGPGKGACSWVELKMANGQQGAA